MLPQRVGDAVQAVVPQGTLHELNPASAGVGCQSCSLLGPAYDVDVCLPAWVPLVLLWPLPWAVVSGELCLLRMCWLEMLPREFRKYCSSPLLSLPCGRKKWWVAAVMGGPREIGLFVPCLQEKGDKSSPLHGGPGGAEVTLSTSCVTPQGTGELPLAEPLQPKAELCGAPWAGGARGYRPLALARGWLGQGAPACPPGAAAGVVMLQLSLVFWHSVF